MLSAEQQKEIETTQETAPTRRAMSEELETILYEPLPVLDHGFVRVVDYMGNDNSIVQAARVSYGKGTKKVSEDKGLINYLMRHWHSTPFEMCEIKFHIKLPMFVARQWIRHRTANVNEYSARYSLLDKEFYIPEPQHLASQSTINNQGRGETLDEINAQKIINMMRDHSEKSYADYEFMLNEKGDHNHPGVARETARGTLPVNFYTQWYWKIDLHNLMHFLMLRADSHAQYEIRAYAEVMLDVLKKWCPHTYEAFINYRLNSNHISEKGMDVIKRRLKGEDVTQETSGLSKREWRELEAVLNEA